jgi:hypothetical protein
MAGVLNGSTVNVTVNGRPQRYTGAYTTETFLRVLGVSPLLGRDFTAADNHEGAEKVARIRYGVWQRDFGGATDSSGTVRINGKSAATRQPGPWRTIVGVMSTVRMTGPFTDPSVDDSGSYVPFYSNPFGPALSTPLVMSFAVAQRRQEFGVRMALGARQTSILALVLRQGVAHLGLGLALGLGITLALAVAAGSGLQVTLFGVDPTDPVIYLGVATLIALVSLVATLVPARRATRVDPMIALRAE